MKWILVGAILGMLVSGCSLIEVRTDTSETKQVQGSASASMVKRTDVRRWLGPVTPSGQEETVVTVERADTVSDHKEGSQTNTANQQVTTAPVVEQGLEWLLTAAAGATGLGGIAAALFKGRAASLATMALRQVSEYAERLEVAETDEDVAKEKQKARTKAQDAGVHRVIQKARGKA